MTDPALKASFGRDVAMLQLVGMNPIVVHGGGPQITDLLEKMGVKSTFRRGMRVTDEKTMNVVEMVVGELNQEIVGLINQHGGKAVGLSGQDGHFIHAKKMLLPPEGGEKEGTDLGLVGDIERIDPELIDLLHSKGFIPVVMPIGVGPEGEAYNINADVVAGKLAETLKAEKLILMTNTPGVLDKQRQADHRPHGERNRRTLLRRHHSRRHAAETRAQRCTPSSMASSPPTSSTVACPTRYCSKCSPAKGSGTMIRSDEGPHFLADSRRYLAPSVTE